MSRIVIVYNYSHKPPKEIGRATLLPNGTAALSGFSRGQIQQYRVEGIRADGPDDTDDIGSFIPLSDGDNFLNQLLLEFSGSYARAVEQPPVTGR